MRVCALSGPLLRLRVAAAVRLRGISVPGDRVLTLRVVVLGGVGVYSRSCVPTYLFASRVFALWTVARGEVYASVSRAARSAVTYFMIM